MVLHISCCLLSPRYVSSPRLPVPQPSSFRQASPPLPSQLVTANSSCVVHVKGWLRDGTIFESTYVAGRPMMIDLGTAIAGHREVCSTSRNAQIALSQHVCCTAFSDVPCLRKALLRMKPGDKWEIKVPPHLAYGKERHGAIPPSSTIYFSLELVSVVPSQPLLDFFKKPTTWGMAAFASYFFVGFFKRIL